MKYKHYTFICTDKHLDINDDDDTSLFTNMLDNGDEIVAMVPYKMAPVGNGETRVVEYLVTLREQVPDKEAK